MATTPIKLRLRAVNLWAVCGFALAALACSAGPTGAGTNAPGESGAGGGRGTTAGSNAAGTGTGGGSATGGGGSAASAGASNGVNATGANAGCGQGTSCTPGNDLAPPPAGRGIQIASPTDMVTVQPGQELFLCYYRDVGNAAEVDVGAFQSWMTSGSSHHFIVFQGGQGALGGGAAQPDGTLQSCAAGGGTWLYATSTAGAIIEMKMPDGVGLPFAANTQIILNMHFVNPTSSPASPQVKLNIVYASSVQYKAASMVSFNTQIDVPPAGPEGPGTQTVTGACTAPAGSKFFLMSTHAHKHMTAADVNLVSGGKSTNLVHSTDWEHPAVATWNAPNFLTVQSGDTFAYSCSYSNSGSTAVTVGETAASNEMCMAIGYYFPAGTTVCL